LNALWLRGNLLSNVPDWLGEIPDLVNLNLMGNHLTSLPVTLSELFEEGIVIADNEVAFAVDDTEQREWLDKFEISGDDSELLQAWRAECVTLREFWPEDESITTWQGLKLRCNDRGSSDSESDSDDVTQVKKQVIEICLPQHLRDGKGTKTTIRLPKYIGRLDGLEYMLLDNKNITSVPEEVGDLKSLKFMSLGSNYLTSLPPELGRLSALKKLYLERNLLESVPEEVGDLIALEELYLNQNKLTSIPARLGSLKSLKILQLSGNKLITVPADLGRLTALISLHIDDNILRSLPTEFRGLCSLKRLILNDNQLTSVPRELGMLTALRMLNLLENNPLRTLPTVVMSMKCKVMW